VIFKLTLRSIFFPILSILAIILLNACIEPLGLFAFKGSKEPDRGVRIMVSHIPDKGNALVFTPAELRVHQDILFDTGLDISVASNAAGFIAENTEWYYSGEMIHTGANYLMRASTTPATLEYEFSFVGVHYFTLEVEIGIRRYSKVIAVAIEYE